jgi:flagellar biosynthesis/type III secretory pathway chaperone
MAGMINKLIEVMNEQAQRYEELLGLSQEKREAIVKNDLEYLQKITRFENILVSQNEKLERNRMEIIKDIASVMGKNEKDMTLATLIELMEGQAEHAELIETGNKIRGIIEELSNVNVFNASLIENALDYIEYSMNVMQTSVNQNHLPTYSVKGGHIREGDSLYDSRK